MKIVLDTNVIISAFLWAGRTSHFFDLIEEKKLTIYTCSEQISELKNVLRRSKFSQPIQRTGLESNAIVTAFTDLAHIIQPLIKVDMVQDDPIDNKILSCALTSRASYLVSGDKHLLKLKKIDSIPILSVNKFLNKFE